ncbi:hypothetical protein, partial [Enterobacter intestinihominis]
TRCLAPFGPVWRCLHQDFFLLGAEVFGLRAAVLPVGAEIIARADAALYRAKEAGRNGWSL